MPLEGEETDRPEHSEAQATDTADRRILVPPGDGAADISFLVEGRELRFYKCLLALTSPVFSRMLNSDFMEKTATVIELPDKHYEDVVLLFEQMHPVLSLNPVTDDSLLTLLSLADEYEVKHVETKCSQYVTAQIDILDLQEVRHKDFTLQSSVDPDQVAEKALLYLTACYLHPGLLEAEPRGKLLVLAANRSFSQLRSVSSFDQVPQSVVTEVIYKRCEVLESLLYSQALSAEERGLNGARACRPACHSPGDTMTAV